MPKINMTISEQILLEKCREVELLCKELYEYFAELYTDNEDAARLWCKTAVEEQNHADQFTLALKLRKGLACTVTADLARLESIQSQMLTVLDRVKTDPPKLEDALSSAIKLEKYLSDFHLGCVVLFEDNSYKKLFDAMMASDQGHISALQELYDMQTGEQEWTFTG